MNNEKQNNALSKKLAAVGGVAYILALAWLLRCDLDTLDRKRQDLVLGKTLSEKNSNEIIDTYCYNIDYIHDHCAQLQQDMSHNQTDPSIDISLEVWDSAWGKQLIYQETHRDGTIKQIIIDFVPLIIYDSWGWSISWYGIKHINDDIRGNKLTQLKDQMMRYSSQHSTLLNNDIVSPQLPVSIDTSLISSRHVSAHPSVYP